MDREDEAVSEAKPPTLPYTILICCECVDLLGMNYGSRIASSLEPSSCQLCGKDKILSEYRTGVTIHQIRDDCR